MEHHKLDVYPVPKEKSPLYINEPWLIDKSLSQYSEETLPIEPDNAEDNIRIYIPMDLNKEAILRRLDYVINHYGKANERNEMNFSLDVQSIISQIEIYDQVWFARHMPHKGHHSSEAISLVEEFVAHLEQIADGCAECFPFEIINDLKSEYLSD